MTVLTKRGAQRKTLADDLRRELQPSTELQAARTALGQARVQERDTGAALALARGALGQRAGPSREFRAVEAADRAHEAAIAAVRVAESAARKAATAWWTTTEPRLEEALVGAVRELDRSLRAAAEPNLAITDVQSLRRDLVPRELGLGPGDFVGLAWNELLSNDSGSGRLDSWRRFVQRELGIDLA